jgi:hypothetical protein
VLGTSISPSERHRRQYSERWCYEFAILANGSTYSIEQACGVSPLVNSAIRTIAKNIEPK